MRWPVNREQSAYLDQLQRINRSRTKHNACENWAAAILESGPLKWKRQSRWGCRLFDFWCHAKGVAIELDGPEHRPEYDAVRDRFVFERSGIIVIRVKNFDESGLRLAIARAADALRWKHRRANMGLEGKTKRLIRDLKYRNRRGIPSAHGDWIPKAL